MDETDRSKAVFRQRIGDVRASIDSERLRVFDPTEGREPLCRFLEQPVPDVEFPSINNLREFWKSFGGS